MRDLRQQRQARPGLIESIKSGLAVPILSDEAIFDLVLPGHPALAQDVCRLHRIPAGRPDNLPRIAKFYKLQRQKEAMEEGGDFTRNDLRADYFDFVKNFVYTQAEQHGADADLLAEAEAQYQRQNRDRVRRAARLPALRPRRRGPAAGAGQPALPRAADHQPLHLPGGGAGQGRQDPAHCGDPLAPGPARPDRPACSRAARRTSRSPLVCHLFGLESYSRSLVLTEDDYLEFLVDVNLNRGDDGATVCRPRCARRSAATCWCWASASTVGPFAPFTPA